MQRSHASGPHRMAQELLSRDDHFEEAVLATTENLWGCYECLSTTVDHSTLATNCCRFATVWVALEEMNAGFRVKPKLHLFQELCEMTGPTQPSAHWTYMDEDFGGSMIGLARRRGGHKTPGSTGHPVISRFTARYPLPKLGY